MEATDAIEEQRGFRPPIFVDVRISRSVRAVGFNGNAFGKMLGPKRYHWMKSLGNERIVTGTGPKIQIADPTASNDLLDLAISAAKENRRVIFFCSCMWCRHCHRKSVASLVLKEAKRRRTPVEIVEWPGGKPVHVHVELEPRLFRAVSNGRLFIPLDDQLDWIKAGGPPWGSIASLHCGDETLHRTVGPVNWQKGNWCLPVCVSFDDPSIPISEFQKESAKFRQSVGCEVRSTSSTR